MRDNDTTRSVDELESAAEALRAVLHHGVRDLNASDVQRAQGEVAAIAASFSAVIDELSRQLDARAGTVVLGHDNDGDVAATVSLFCHQMGCAANYVDAAVEHLKAAVTEVSHLTDPDVPTLKLLR